MQEAFVKLWKKCKDVPPNKAKSFLFTVANNLMLNEFNHQKVVLKYQQKQTKKVNHQDPQFLVEEKERRGVESGKKLLINQKKKKE